MNTQQLMGRRVWMRTVRSLVVASASLAIFGATLLAKPPGNEPVKLNGVEDKKAPVGATDPAAASTKAEALKGPKPVAKADEEAHDFGPVWVGPPLKHTFKIKNEGEKPLDIIKVKPSCGCTIAGDHPKSLAPGETGEFPFSLQSTKLRGNFEKGITISTNDPATPDLRLKLRGEVKRYVEVVPQGANFGKVTAQEVQERVINITGNAETPLQLTLKPAADTGKFKFDLVEKTPGKQFDLHVTATPPFEEGVMKTVLTLVTNVEAQKEIQIEVTATVPPRVEVQPNEITLNRPRPDAPPSTEATSRIIRVTNYDKNPIKVLEAVCDDPAVTVVVTERKPGEAYTVQVTMPAGYVPPAEGKMVTIKTDDSKKPTHQVPIRMPELPAQSARSQVKPSEGLVGQPAPSFSLTTLEGKVVSNDTVTQNVTVMNFIAPNCGFCKKQIPRVEPLREKFAAQGVRFVAVSQKMGNKDFSQPEVVEILNGLNFKGEVALDHGNTVGPMFKASSYPTMVVIGKNGKVEAVNSGNLADLETRLTSQLEAVLAGKPAPSFVTAAPTPTTAEAPPRGKPEDMLGLPAPSFTLGTVAGKPIGNADFSNAPATVLNFFAPNCGFCKKQIPRLETVRKTYVDKGVRFVNVAETMGREFSEEDTLKILKDLGAELEVARDPGNKVGPLFNANGFPTMVIIGKNGKVEAVNVGNVGDLESKLQTQLDALIAGKSPRADANGRSYAIPRLSGLASMDADGQQPAGEAPKPAPAPAPAPTPAPAPAQQPTQLKVQLPPPAAKPAPAITLTTLDGKPVSNAEFAGAPATVLNFFAPNCGYCKKQIPQLEAIRKTYAAKGVRFINVWETMGKEFTKEETLEILKGLGAELEVAHDPGNKFGPAFGASGFPTMVVVGKTGNIEATNIGALPDLATRVPGQLDALIAGKPIPAQFAQAPPKPAAPKAASKVGQTAPAIALTTFDGKSLANADFANYPATVLNFYANNCGYCKKQIPRLETIRKQYADKGVRFVNVTETMGKEFTKDETIATLKEIGSELEVAADPGNKIGPGFGTAGFPTMVIVGKSGKIEAINIGNIGDLETKVQGQLDALIAGKPIPAVAAAPAAAPGAAPGAPPAEKPKRPAMQLVGQTAPAFTLDTFDGKKISSDDFKDHPATVLNFVAPNCGFCKKQLPGVETVRAEYEAKGVRFVNIAQKMGKDFTDAEITDTFKGVGSKLELAKDADNKIGQMYKAQSFPTMMVVDRTGKIAHVNIGAQQDLDKSLKTQLDALIGGAGKGTPGGK